MNRGLQSAWATAPALRPCRTLLARLGVIRLFGLLACSVTAFAGELIVTLAVPDAPVPAGSTVHVSLLAANPGSTDQAFAVAGTLEGTLWQANHSWGIVLTAPNPQSQIVAPERFASFPYSLRLPEGLTGEVILEVSGGLPHPARTVISISGVESKQEGIQAEPEAPPLPKVQYHTVASSLQRTFANHFTPFEPVYFIYGPKAPGAKFQFSFKYRILSFDDSLGGMDSPSQQTLQFGYTQRSLWDVNASSSPFYDTSYMPSFFYQYLSKATQQEEDRGGAKWLGVQSGYQHESNGQGSVESRSLNTLYFRTGALLGRADRWHAIVQGRVFEYIGGLSDNPNLKDYRGYADWQVVVARGSGPSLSYTGRAGQDLSHFTSQFDLNIPVKTHLLDFATYFLVQYFDGYGESLRSYDKHADTVRAGVSLVR